MNELEQMLSESTRRSRHLWAHLSTVRECIAEGLPIVKSKMQTSHEQMLQFTTSKPLPPEKLQAYKNELVKNYQDLLARQEFATSNVLYVFGYAITEAQSLDSLNVALKADANFRASLEKSFGKDYKATLERAGLVRRAKILLDLGQGIRIVVPHMKGDLSLNTLSELTVLHNQILHGDGLKLNTPIDDLNGKLEYLKHSCIYLSDLVMLKYDLFKIDPGQLGKLFGQA